MKVLYTATDTFDQNYGENGTSWKKYIEWSKLTHLNEVVSLDGLLSELLVEPDYDNLDDWNYIHSIKHNESGLFTTLEYVLKRLNATDKYNLLAVVIEPEKECKDLEVNGFEFVGYDLIDQDFCISALTNCGGFDETFLPHDLNKKGLIDDFIKAYDIKKRLLENNPMEYHADTSVIAIWRHLTIGR